MLIVQPILKKDCENIAWIILAQNVLQCQAVFRKATNFWFNKTYRSSLNLNYFRIFNYVSTPRSWLLVYTDTLKSGRISIQGSSIQVMFTEPR